MGISYCSSAELYFLSLICAFHDEEARVKWCPPPPTNMVRPTEAFGFRCHWFLYLQQRQTNFLPNKFLAVEFRAFHACPGSPGRQRPPWIMQGWAPSTLCIDQSLITFRYFLKLIWGTTCFVRFPNAQFRDPGYSVSGVLDYLALATFTADLVAKAWFA